MKAARKMSGKSLATALIDDQHTTVFVLKPDAIHRRLEESIVRMLRERRYCAIGSKRMRFTPNSLKLLYQSTFRKYFKEGISDPRAAAFIDYMLSDMCLVIIVRHEEYERPGLLNHAGKLRGDDWIPHRCKPGTLRYELRRPNLDGVAPVFDKNGRIVGAFPENVCHTPSTMEEFTACVAILSTLGEEMSQGVR